jgi:hypothetical protein
MQLRGAGGYSGRSDASPGKTVRSFADRVSSQAGAADAIHRLAELLEIKFGAMRLIIMSILLRPGRISRRS